MISRALAVPFAALLTVPLLILALASQDTPTSKPSVGITFPEGNPDYMGPYAQEIFFAVLEGLYADGVTTEVVDKIVAIDERTRWPANFVYACPVCMPAYQALIVYQKRPKLYGMKGEPDTFGEGLREETVRLLTGKDNSARRVAIQKLIEDWLRRRMESKRLTEEERAQWALEMEKRRKQGMSFLEQYRQQGVGGDFAWMKSCPICDGASAACKAR